MSNNFKKVLYLGASDHIEVVNIFPNCNEFILVDTKPRSEHDVKYYFYEGFYRINFLKAVINKLKKYGFILDKTIELEPNYVNLIETIETNNHNTNKDLNTISYINPHLLLFKNEENNNRIVKYYISTNILFNMNSLLRTDIYEADTLYDAGYHPNIELLKYFSSNGNIKKKNFVGDNNTCYYIDYDDDEDNIIKNFINNTFNMNDYFDNYYLVWRKKSMIILCDNLEDINNKKNKL
jgi:hypothetical protein